MDGRIERILRQIDWKGFAAWEDLLQFVDAEVPIVARLAARLGMTPRDVKDMAERQKIAPVDVRAVAFQ